jgi:hypothetical protein
VTVIATGFDRKAGAQEGPLGRAVPNVLPFPQRQSGAAVRPPARPSTPAPRPSTPAAPEMPDISEMEIPTFIRRQMD